MSKIRACTKRHYEITGKDLPLCCPMPDMRLWDAHPRVYLPIHETGHELCPYCGAEYTLKDFVTVHGVSLNSGESPFLRQG